MPAIVRAIVRPIVRSVVRDTWDGVAPVHDLFVIVGQSNAEGRGDSSTSPDATANGLYFNGTTFSALADPVGGALTGSMWPAYCNEWYVKTSRKSAWAEAATGSTRLLDYGDPTASWAPTGNLRAGAAVQAQAAVAALLASSTYSLGNVYFVWAQGEGDAENLDATHTAAMYRTALASLATYFKAQVPQMTQMLVVRSAMNINDATKDAGYALIRAAQEDACTDSDLLTMVYRGTMSARPLGYIATNVHYTQPFLNICGKAAARGQYSPGAPATLSAVTTTAYTDTDYATTASTRTISHTTAVGTKFVVFDVGTMRPNSASTYTISSVTAGGHAATLARLQADNGTTASRVVNGIYYLDETAYGGSLSNVTFSLVVTADQACNLIDVAVVESPDDLYIDYALSANSPTDSQAALSLDYYTGAPALTVVAASSAGAGAAAATCVLSNVTTEILDAGGTNATRIGQACMGYSIDTADYGARTITATFSSNQNAISLVVASFRRRIDGE